MLFDPGTDGGINRYEPNGTERGNTANRKVHRCVRAIAAQKTYTSVPSKRVIGQARTLATNSIELYEYIAEYIGSFQASIQVGKLWPPKKRLADSALLALLEENSVRAH